MTLGFQKGLVCGFEGGVEIHGNMVANRGSQIFGLILTGNPVNLRCWCVCVGVGLFWYNKKPAR
jgi:hypothetical protein